ncbi:MAG TPA: SRPBCC family protein [Promicromonospora sp.]|nr:SRPBCC family protein [Promicromonospora sp.]
MATRRFELTARVPVPPDAAIDALADLTRHAGLHPFFVSAQVVGTGSGPDGPWQDWRVVERPPLGPLRYRLRFGARVARPDARTMVTAVRAAPGCTLRTTTQAAPDGDGDGAILTETTHVTAPLAVVGYMARQARVAHERVLARLPGHLGG